jgi:hypothetical protein
MNTRRTKNRVTPVRAPSLSNAGPSVSPNLTQDRKRKKTNDIAETPVRAPSLSSAKPSTTPILTRPISISEVSGKFVPLSAAERQRRRRAKIAADPDLCQEFKAKECDRWHKRVNQHKIKLVADLTAREQRSKRKMWRQKWAERVRKNESVAITHVDITPNTQSNNLSRQSSSGRKKVKRDRSAAYRRMKLLERNLNKAVSVNVKLRKRLSRKRQTNVSNTSGSVNNTPRKLAKQTMKSPRKTAKALLYHFSVLSDLKDRMKKNNPEQRRAALQVFCAAKLVKKHRLLFRLRQDIGLRVCRQNKNLTNKNFQRMKQVHSKRKAVETYFLRDDVSRSTSGKSETVTKNQLKKTETFPLASCQ